MTESEEGESTQAWTSPRANRAGAQKISRIQELLKDPVALKHKKMKEIEQAQEEIESEVDRRYSLDRKPRPARSSPAEVIIPDADDWVEQMEIGGTPDVNPFAARLKSPPSKSTRTTVTSPSTQLTPARALDLQKRTAHLQTYDHMASDDEDDTMHDFARKTAKITSFFTKPSKSAPEPLGTTVIYAE
jgi:hypothetical protein